MKKENLGIVLIIMVSALLVSILFNSMAFITLFEAFSKEEIKDISIEASEVIIAKL